jgi:sterol desaturase/sphingolipid hydroxylase (fatty acid hydroxylase superfamily)
MLSACRNQATASSSRESKVSRLFVSMATEIQTQRTVPSTKDSMKSTWRSADKSQWGFHHWLMEILSMHPTNIDQPVPTFSKTDKVPHIPSWLMHRWIIVHAFIPLALHQVYVYFTGKNISAIGAFAFYSLSFKVAAIHHLQLMRWTGHRYGFFDGDKYKRDEVPDQSVSKVANSLLSTSTFRPIMFLMLTYRASQTPASINWAWLPLEVSLYGPILDFWFYWYHRIMHDNDSLWKYHRTHHLTKHPNPLLTLYADEPQELFDIAVIPFLAWASLKLLGLPMDFYSWWVCSQYVVFAELAGHSGLRIHAIAPNPMSWLLELFECELVIEDHDLHHRTGWKKSHNYGKQTRLWDKVFGTFRERIECGADNIDYKNLVLMPIFFNPSEPVKTLVETQQF